MTVTDNILEMFHRYWGYTDSEGRFLYLIATQSGYFVHKHYADFLGIAPNKRTTALISKALSTVTSGSGQFNTAFIGPIICARGEFMRV